MEQKVKYNSVLILGTSEKVRVFRFLRHFHLNIDIIDQYDFRELNYKLIITDRQNLDSISNFDGLIFNIEDKEHNFSTIKNTVNLVMNFKYNQDLIEQFINNSKWNFYYKSVEKSNVKFIYDLFSTCNSYNKIVSSEIKFHKIE